MERDRRIALAIQAAVEGVIDFRTARPRDKTWWVQYRLLTEAMQRRSDFQMFDAAYRFHLALLGNSSLTAHSFEEAQQSAQERFWDLAGIVRPWEGESYRERKQQEFTDYRQQYIDAFGVDPADPAFKQWEAEQIAKLRAEDTQAPETEEERIIRRLRERGAKK